MDASGNLEDDAAWFEDIFGDNETNAATTGTNVNNITNTADGFDNFGGLGASDSFMKSFSSPMDEFASQAPAHSNQGYGVQASSQQGISRSSQANMTTSNPGSSAPQQQIPKPTIQRTVSMTSTATVDEELPPGFSDPLISMFRYIRKKRKLKLQMISDQLNVSKTSLSKWNSGKHDHWNDKKRVEQWIYSPENAQALKSYREETEQKNMYASQHLQKHQLEDSQRRTPSLDQRGYPNNPSMFQRPPSAVSHSYDPLSHAGRNAPIQRPGSRNTIERRSPYPPTNVEYQAAYRRSPHITNAAPGAPESNGPYGLRQSGVIYNNERPTSSVSQTISGNVGPSGQVSNGVHPYEGSGPLTRGHQSWQHQSTFRILADKVKQETDLALHKDIDSAINDYLNTAKNLNERLNQAKNSQNPAEKTAQLDYFYKQQGKVLLNRLTTICGDDVVRRATTYIGARKLLRPEKPGGGHHVCSHSPQTPHNTPGAHLTTESQRLKKSHNSWDKGPGFSSTHGSESAVSKTVPGGRPGSDWESAAKRGSMKSRMETQQMVQLTRIWNHCCSCHEDKCTFFSCSKIKPSVLHQRQLRDQKRTCNVQNCAHCMLYQKLKSFSSTSRAHSGAFLERHRDPSNAMQPYKGPERNRVPARPGHSGYSASFRHDSFRSESFTHERSSSRGAYTSHTKEEKSRDRNTKKEEQKGYNGANYIQNNVLNENNNVRNTNYSQNNVVNNNTNYSNMNVNYNTYNIHTNSNQPSRPVRPEDEDMSTVAEMLDERKHVSINVNVNINNNRNEGNEFPQENVKKERGFENPDIKTEARNAPAYGKTSESSQKRKAPSENMPYDYENIKVKKQRDTPNSYYNNYQNNNNYGGADNSARARAPATSTRNDEEDDLSALLNDPGPSQFVRARNTDAQREAGFSIDNQSQANSQGSRLLCVICQQKDRDTLFLPCNHCCACKDCAYKVHVCPMCRSPISDWSSIYLS